jgi:Protein of unknown function (DUF3617)
MKIKMKIMVAVSAGLLVVETGLAMAQSMPQVKAGLWESTVLRDGAKAKKEGKVEPTTSTACIDDTVMEQMMKMGQGMAQSMCSKNTSQISGNKMTGSVECKMAGSTINSTSVTTFNGNTSYRTEAKSIYTPPLHGMKESTTITEAKYVGPCKAGMKPGDINAMGITMNVLEMNKMMGAKK